METAIATKIVKRGCIVGLITVLRKWDSIPIVIVAHQVIKELKQRGRERQRERGKTMDKVREYNHCTWERNHLVTFPPSSLESEREKLNSRVL